MNEEQIAEVMQLATLYGDARWRGAPMAAETALRAIEHRIRSMKEQPPILSQAVEGGVCVKVEPVEYVTLESALEAIDYLSLSNSRGRESDARRMLVEAPEARAALDRPAVREGWVMVPVEPTDEMWRAADKADNAAYCDGAQHGAGIAALWDAMLAAAPKEPTQEPENPDGVLLPRDCRADRRQAVISLGRLGDVPAKGMGIRRRS